MWGLLISNFRKILKIFLRRNFVFCNKYSSMKRMKSIVANAKVMVAFFIHMHIVIMRHVRIVRNIINIREISVLLNRCWNI